MMREEHHLAIHTEMLRTRYTLKEKERSNRDIKKKKVFEDSPRYRGIVLRVFAAPSSQEKGIGVWVTKEMRH
jgi:ribosomal protein S12